MRILQLIQKKQLRGAEVFACQLSNNLLALGHELKVVALLEGAASLPFEGDVAVVGINLKARMFDYKGWKTLAAVIDEYKPDVVQANAGDTLKYASISKKLFGWKAKLVFRNANKMGDFIDTLWKKQFNTWLLKEVDFVASVSEECKNDFAEVFNWPHNKISTLPIGVDTAEATNHNPLNEMQWASAFPVLLSVASFVQEKNHNGLISIFSKLLAVYPDARLILIGEGKLKQIIMEKCNALGMADKVWFAGRRNDVGDFMQNSNALLMPSLIEGLPGVILEAFANELPVVAYNVGGIPEVIKDGETGYLASKHDEADFLDKLKILFALNINELEKMKLHAKALIIEEYSNRKIAGKFEMAYQNLLKGSKPNEA